MLVNKRRPREWALNELLTANEEDEIIQDLFPL